MPNGFDQRLKASLAQFDDLAKLHFDDTFTTEAIEANWRRYASGAVAGLIWAAENNDHAAAYNILGVSVHAVQDFYTHSNWVDDASRRRVTWHELPKEERARQSLYAGAYELPATTAPASHGKVSFECSVYGRPEIAPVMEQVCTGLSPFAEAPQCQSYLRYCRNGQATAISLEGLNVDALVLSPPGIALDNSWLAKVGGNVRGLTTAEGAFSSRNTENWLSLNQCNAVANLGVACDEETPARDVIDANGQVVTRGVCPRVQPRSCAIDSDRLFATSKFLAIESTTQWVSILDGIMQRRHAKFWSEVKQGVNSSVAQREAQFERFDKLPFQFLSAGDYPVSGSESDGYYIRLRIRTADTQGAGTDADVSARVYFASGNKEFKLDYMPTDADAGLRSNRLLVYNDFEQGDNDVYTIGPVPEKPTWISLVNDAADAGDVMAALGEEIYDAIAGIFTDPEATFLPLISGEADYVGETTVRLSFDQLRQAAQSSTQALKIDASKDGEYDLQYSVTASRNGLSQDRIDKGWVRFTLSLDTLKCIRESEWDRASDSDEPFFFFSASPLNGANNATQYFNQSPLSDVDDGESVTLSASDMVFDLSPQGVLVLAFQLYEHDEESQATRDALFNTFKTGIDQSANTSNSKFLDELGRALGSTWTIAEVDAYAFRRGAQVEIGNVLNAKGPIEIGPDFSHNFQLLPGKMYIATLPDEPDSPANWRAQRRFANFAPSLRTVTPPSAENLRALTTVPAPNARVQIRPSHSGKCVGVVGEAVQSWFPVTQQACRPGAQKWVMNSMGSGVYLVIAAHSAGRNGPQCMQPATQAGSPIEDGTQIMHTSCEVRTDRFWRVDPVGAGFRFRFGQTNKCLDVQGASTSEHAVIEMQECVSGTASQIFQFFGE